MPKPPKPIALWITQLLFLLIVGIAVFAMANALWSGRIAYVGATFVTLSIPAAIALIVGIQLRHRWAHLASAGVIALLCVAFIWKELQKNGAGGIAGAVLSNVLFLLLAWRVGFGEPARAYFASKPVRRPPSFEDS